MTDYTIHHGDALSVLKGLPDESVQSCITSPPYFGLRDYGVTEQIGLEPTPADYVARLVAVFEEVRRVLKPDGTCWVNLGDSYATSNPVGRRDTNEGQFREGRNTPEGSYTVNGRRNTGLKPKDLMGIPWRVAFALQDAGWWLRQDIIWSKSNPMPESVEDRCTKSHEYVFLLAKNPRYFFDAEAIREASAESSVARSHILRSVSPKHVQQGVKENRAANMDVGLYGQGRNKRSVWSTSLQPYAEAHFATFPPKLIEPMVLAGSREGDTILDPFSGSGTTGLVALRHRRNYVGIELNPDYIQISERRLSAVQVEMF